MSAVNRRTEHECGFTLVELVTVLVIAAVLLMVAVPSMIAFRRSSELNAVTNGLLAAINAARTEAMRRGTRVELVPNAADDWATGWRVFVDADLDGALSSGDPVLLQQALPAGAPWYVVGTGTAAGGGDKYLLFDGSGYARSKAGAFSASTITIQRVDATDGTRLVKLARTGRVRSCDPARSSDCDSSED